MSECLSKGTLSSGRGASSYGSLSCQAAMWLPEQHKEPDAWRHVESSAAYQRNTKKLLPTRQQRCSVHAQTPKEFVENKGNNAGTAPEVWNFLEPTELKWQRKVPELPNSFYGMLACRFVGPWSCRLPLEGVYGQVERRYLQPNSASSYL